MAILTTAQRSGSYLVPYSNTDDAGITYNPHWTANSTTLSALDIYLVAYWKGEDLTDEINSHTLTNNNSVTFTAGKHNNAFTLNGTDQYLTAPASTDFVMSGDFTLSAWFKTTDAYTDYILDFRDASNTSSQGLFVFNTHIEYFVNNSDAITTDTTYNDGNWHHVAVTRIGSTITLYMDAVSKGTYSYSASIPQGGCYIGTRYSLEDFFDGQIDEVAVWKGHGMLAAEVSALYNSGTGAFYI